MQTILFEGNSTSNWMLPMPFEIPILESRVFDAYLLLVCHFYPRASLNSRIEKGRHEGIHGGVGVKASK